jgi:hypothetical protein
MISGLTLVALVQSTIQLVTFLTCCCHRRYCTRSHHCSLSDFTSISLHMLVTVRFSTHTLSCLFMYCSFASTGMLMWLSRQIVYSVCTCCLFLFVIFLLQDILFVMTYLVVVSFHFQFLLSDLPSINTRPFL